MEKSFGTPNINCHSDKENPLINLKKKEFKINTQHKKISGVVNLVLQPELWSIARNKIW